MFIKFYSWQFNHDRILQVKFQINAFCGSRELIIFFWSIKSLLIFGKLEEVTFSVSRSSNLGAGYWEVRDYAYCTRVDHKLLLFIPGSPISLIYLENLRSKFHTFGSNLKADHSATKISSVQVWWICWIDFLQNV